MELSNGALADILRGVKLDINPVFQFFGSRKLETTNSNRSVIALSDGINVYSRVIAKTEIVVNISDKSIIQATRYFCRMINPGKDIIYLKEIKVLAKGEDFGIIGNPVRVNLQLPTAASVQSNHSDQPKQLLAASTSEPVTSGTTETNASRPIVQNQGGLSQETLKRPMLPPPTRTQTIASLTPNHSRWRIKALVTMKSSIRTYNNTLGDGRLFNVMLADSSGEISCTGFDKEVDKFYSMLKINKIYYISNCNLKTVEEGHRTLNCDYSMTMKPQTIIKPCCDNDEITPMMNFNFVKIADLDKYKNGSNVDIIGIVKIVKNPETVIGKKSQKEMIKRDIQLVDQSGMAVRVTLWEDDAANFNNQELSVVAIKNAEVSEFGGRCLSVSGRSQLLINPDVKASHNLRRWFDTQGREQFFRTFSDVNQATSWKTFFQVKMENLSQGDKNNFFTAKGKVIDVKKDCLYQACPTAECNKKVVDQENGLFRCDKCNKEFPIYKWRMILSVNVEDDTDNQWIKIFGELAESLINISASELNNVRETNEMQFGQILQDVLFKEFIFRLRAKMVPYQEKDRLDIVCVGIVPVD